MSYELFLVNRIIKKKYVKRHIYSIIVNIAIGTIAIGIAIINISVSTGVGLQKEIKNNISNYQGHMSITSYDRNLNLTTPISINQDFYPNFKHIKGISKVQPYCNVYGIIKKNDYFEGIIIKGVDSDYNMQFFKKKLIDGKMIQIYPKKLNDTVLISKKISNKLKLYLNQKFNIFFIQKDGGIKLRTFFVGGIFKTAINDFDDNFIIGDIKHVQKINNLTKDSVTGFEVTIDDISKLKIKAKQIYKSIPYYLDVSTIEEKNSNLMSWLSLFDTNIAFIIIIILIVCSINIIATLLIIIIEKNNLINILKYLGATNLSIRKIFIYICSSFVIKGLIIGNVFSISILLIQKYFNLISLDENIYYVDSIVVFIDPKYIIISNMLILLVCMLVIIAPSRLVKKHNVINIT